MFLEIISFLTQIDTGFSVFQYLTLRAILSTLTALVICLFIGKRFIKVLTNFQIHQTIRKDGPKSHYKKQGTPTMGGILIISSFLMSILVWGNWHHHYLWVVIITTLAFGTIGFIDDFLKIKKQNSNGLNKLQKYSLQSIVAVLISVWLYEEALLPNETELIIPFFKEVVIPLGFGFVVLSYFVIVGSSNAVNLTDGLDGLAIMPIILIAATLAIFAYATGHSYFSSYLNLPFIFGAGELIVVCGALIGAGIGFLWFNTYPAQIFMGDIGSLTLGAVLAVIAIIIRQEFLLFVIGGVFVAETISVILQIGSYKIRKKRIFLMAPLHHHFEKKGWAEPKIIVRFWMITLMLILIGLSSLKIR